MQSHKAHSPEKKALHGCPLVQSFPLELSSKWISLAWTNSKLQVLWCRSPCCTASCIDLNNRFALYARCVRLFFHFYHFWNTAVLRLMQSSVGQRQSLCAVAGRDVDIFWKICHNKAEVTLLKPLSNCRAFLISDVFFSDTNGSHNCLIWELIQTF